MAENVIVPQNMPHEDVHGLIKLQRVLLTLLSVPGFVALFSMVFVIPVFHAMFADFGAQLPFPTILVLDSRYIYAAFAVLIEIRVLYLIFGTTKYRNPAILILAILGIEYIVLILTISALFLPIFSMMR